MDFTAVIKDLGRPLPDDVLREEGKYLFKAEEGMVQLIYGRIRQGKSTEAVRRMYESLTNGRVVYSNIRLDLSSVEFDDRLDISVATSNFLRSDRRFYRFRKENFHWFDPSAGICDGKRVFDPQIKGAEIAWLNTLTDCEIYYDEGQWLLDSYESTFASVEKRKFITETGHMNRLIVIIAQRTQSVHVNARGNVNQFFRCQKITKWLFFRALRVEEFQDMKGNDVDEDAEPVSVHEFMANKKYWRLFNTHYLRAGRPASQQVAFDAYDLSFDERIVLLYFHLYAFVARLAGVFTRLKPGEDTGVREARPDFSEVLHEEPVPSLGVESIDATLKSGERLNTVPARGKKRLDFKAINERRKLEKLRKEQQAEKDQIGLPF